MEDLLKKLKQTSSTNSKLELLRQHASNKDILKCFQLAYNPFIIFNISDIPSPIPGKYRFDNVVNLFYKLCDKLSTREVTGNNARYAVSELLSMCNADTQDVFIKILKKDLKVGVNESLLNKAFGRDFIKSFDVQLANNYKDKMNSKDIKNVKYFWASKKMDGLRGFFKDNNIFTRNGHILAGFDNIIEELSTIDATFIDGELYSHSIKFNKIQSAVMKNKNIDSDIKSKIFFNVFVVGKDGYRDTEEMINYLNSIDWSKFKYIRKVEYVKVKNDESEIRNLCESFISDGYEGAMLRHPENWYDFKRSNSLLKYKLFVESDFVVDSVYEGDKGTKYENSLGGISVKGKYNSYIIKSDVGSGFDDADREYYWNNKNEIIGKTVEIKFQGITDDNTSLRFPVFMKVKMDR